MQHYLPNASRLAKRSVQLMLNTIITFCLFSSVNAYAETEPNNDKSLASGIALNSSQQGSIGESDLDDWWKIDVNEAGVLTVFDSVLTASSSGASLYSISLYDDDGVTRIASSQTRWSDNSGSRIKLGVLPGTYYVHIKRNSYSCSYNLNPKFISMPEDVMMNDVKASAQDIRLNTENVGNIGHWNVDITDLDREDWWKIDIDEAGVLYIIDSVSYAASSGASLYSITLFDIDGETSIYSSQTRWSDNSGTRIKIGVLPGTYYLRIKLNSYYGSYKLYPKFTAMSEDVVMNDSLEIAQNLKLNAENIGNIGHWNVDITDLDREDWWKIDIDKAGVLYIVDSVTYAASSGASLYNITLFDIDGETKVATTLTRWLDNSGTRIKTGVLPGTYYLRIKRNNYYGAYKIYPHFTAMPEDVVMNDSLEIAQNIELNTENVGNIGHWNVDLTGLDIEDWWQVNITEAGVLHIIDSVSYAASSGASLYNITLFDTDGETKVATTLTRWLDNSGTRVKTGVLPGTYYIRIQRNSYYGAYSIYPEFTTMPEDVVMNDSLEIAQKLVLNTENVGNIGHWNVGITDRDNRDWWQINITKAGELHIIDSISYAASSGASLYSITLYDNDGVTTLYNFQTRWSDNSGTRIKVGVLPGNYYLRIKRNSYYGAYNIYPKFTEVPEDIVMNDSLEIAQDLKLNRIDTANIGHWNVDIKGIDKEDWWKLTLEEAGVLTIIDSIKQSSGISASLYSITLYEEDGETTAASSRTRWPSNTGSRIQATLEAGNYYVRIKRNSYYGVYTLQPKFIPVPEARFTSNQNVSNFLFSNTSLDGENYKWSFGDGTSSEEANTSHTYSEPGDYEVELIAYNSAGSDTSSQIVSVYGIRDFNPKQGGNTGPVTLTILGGGMQADTQVKLSCQGCEDILGYNIALSNVGALQVSFNLNGKDLDTYTIEIINDGKEPIIRNDAFDVVLGNSPKPWVNVNGRSKALLNRWQTYTIEYGNTGNVDAELVPIIIAISNPDQTEIVFPDLYIPYSNYVTDEGLESAVDSIDLFFDLDTFLGENTKTRVFPLYLPKIPAGYTGSFRIKIKTSGTTAINVWNTQPLVSNGEPITCCIDDVNLKTVSITAEGDNLMAKCLYESISLTLDLMIEGVANKAPIIGCIYNLYKLPVSLTYGLTSIPQEDRMGLVVVGSLVKNLAPAVIACISDVVSAPVKAVLLGITVSMYVYDIYGATTTCMALYEKQNVTRLPVKGVTSFDPNEIVGPAGYGTAKYISGIESATYSIYFENKDTASAPAQEVFVRDTLDLDAFDISSFSFKSVTIADTTIAIPFGQQEYAIDIDMRPKQNIIARCVGTLDTLSGVVVMYFNSLDAETMEQNEDPEAGILLPNVNKPEGEGHVTFSLGVKNIVHDAQFSNQASIVFDFNKAIETNVWTNTFDLNAPSSHVDKYEYHEGDNTLNLDVSRNDEGVGVRHYRLFVSINDSDYVALPLSSEEVFTYQLPKEDVNLKFYSLAVDSLGHQELTPTVYDLAYAHTYSSLNTIDFNSSIHIKPNPTTGIVTIEGQGIIALSLIDAKGNELVHKEDNLSELSLLPFAKGLYFVRVVTERGVATKKLLYR